MLAVGLLRRFWRLAVRRVETLVFYAYCRARQGDGREDPCVRYFDAAGPPEGQIERDLIAAQGRLAYAMMRRRMVRHGARLLCLVEDGRLGAYGWIQRWVHFRRRYAYLAADATMLGFFWTAPACRGRGMFGRLMAHAIAVCEERRRVPLLVMTSPANRASQRGIEKAGFIRLGTYRITSWLFQLVVRTEVLTKERTLAEALRQCEDAGEHPS